MKEVYTCVCGCKSVFETDTTPPTSVKCFKCKAKISRKDSKKEELEPASK